MAMQLTDFAVLMEGGGIALGAGSVANGGNGGIALNGGVASGASGSTSGNGNAGNGGVSIEPGSVADGSSVLQYCHTTNVILVFEHSTSITASYCIPCHN